MFGFFAFLLGSFLSAMISINGSLVACFDSYTATAVIHFAGLTVTALILLFTHKRICLDPHLPKWIYSAGIIGILTTIFQASSVGTISMLSISALGLLGQTCTSLLIDTFGWLGMKKHPFQKSTLIGFAFALAGIFFMLDSSVNTAFAAVIMSFSAGISVVTSRSMNARIAESSGTMQGTFLNFATAFPVTLILAFCLGNSVTSPADFIQVPWWVYMGGIMGVASVVMNNFLVPRLSAFQLTLLVFLGQLAGSLAIDLFTGAETSARSLTGGLLIAAGMILNMVIKNNSQQKHA